MYSATQLVFIGLAALAAGIVNALAGGGTLILFPALLAAGIPPVCANVTCTASLWPGYLGATFAQSRDLRGQRRRLWLVLPSAAVGGVMGGVLLLYSPEKVFDFMVPFLLLLSSALLAIQDPLRAWLTRRAEKDGAKHASERWVILPIGLAAIYGGYFGAGLSVIVLAVLALLLNDTLTRLNALKQFVAFATNITTAIFFLFSGKVVWPAAAVIAVGAVVGGVAGGHLAGRIKPKPLRWIVVTLGAAVGVYYLVRK